MRVRVGASVIGHLCRFYTRACYARVHGLCCQGPKKMQMSLREEEIEGTQWVNEVI